MNPTVFPASAHPPVAPGEKLGLVNQNKNSERVYPYIGHRLTGLRDCSIGRRRDHKIFILHRRAAVGRQGETICKFQYLTNQSVLSLLFSRCGVLYDVPLQSNRRRCLLHVLLHPGNAADHVQVARAINPYVGAHTWRDSFVLNLVKPEGMHDPRRLSFSL